MEPSGPPFWSLDLLLLIPPHGILSENEENYFALAARFVSGAAWPQGTLFSVEGYAKANGEEDPRARFRTVSPGFFAALGVPIIAGRDFNDADCASAEPVVIVSQSLAQRMFPNQDALNRHLMWTDPVMKFIDVKTTPRRIVGISADLDDENVVPGPAISVFHPFEQEIGGGRLFVHASIDPYTLVPSITRIIRELSGRSAGREGGDARRHPRRSAGAGSSERARLRRVRRRRGRDRSGRRCGRAGVLGERADA